jgi:hypothetical protein
MKAKNAYFPSAVPPAGGPETSPRKAPRTTNGQPNPSDIAWYTAVGWYIPIIMMGPRTQKNRTSVQSNTAVDTRISYRVNRSLTPTYSLAFALKINPATAPATHQKNSAGGTHTSCPLQTSRTLGCTLSIYNAQGVLRTKRSMQMHGVAEANIAQMNEAIFGACKDDAPVSLDLAIARRWTDEAIPDGPWSLKGVAGGGLWRSRWEGRAEMSPKPFRVGGVTLSGVCGTRAAPLGTGRRGSP